MGIVVWYCYLLSLLSCNVVTSVHVQMLLWFQCVMWCLNFLVFIDASIWCLDSSLTGCYKIFYV
jgi:hypothetical protein